MDTGMLEKQVVEEQDLEAEDSVILMMVVLTMVDGMVIIQTDNQYNVTETHV
jgi:hypothetical protein